MRIDGKVALITGGASGLGFGTARAIAAKGGKIVLLDRSREGIDGALDALRAEAAIGHVADVVDEDAVGAGIQLALDTFGRLDICVNCAGVGVAGKTFGSRGPLPLQDFRSVIEVNLIGTFNVMRLAAQAMARNEPDPETGERGVIVNTASAAAYEGQMGQAAYAASKAGIVGLNMPVARDLSALGIRVNAIAPGLFDTAMTAGLPDPIRDGLIENMEFPKRMGDPLDFGALAVHLAENPYINGETVKLDAASRAPAR